jgi:hypothetical protein
MSLPSRQPIPRDSVLWSASTTPAPVARRLRALRCPPPLQRRTRSIKMRGFERNP